jgi:hypothetical protein
MPRQSTEVLTLFVHKVRLVHGVLEHLARPNCEVQLCPHKTERLWARNFLQRGQYDVQILLLDIERRQGGTCQPS